MKLKKNPLLIIVIAAIAFAGLSYAELAEKNELGDDQKSAPRIGEKAPELAFEDPEGKVRKLSDLQGKIVLIDFWASWCRPCRYENPNLVKAYKKYKDANFKNAEGFEIYSVSLDRKKGDWVKAIKQDNLTWDNHVSDLKFWQSAAAAKYGVTSIPASFLVDSEGVIIAKNLRGGTLDRTLEKLVE